MEDRVMDIRKKYDMKHAEVEILYFLSKCGGQNTSTDIHKHLMMNKGHISQVADSLCRRGFLTAIPDQNDRRYVHYEVTESAQAMADEITEIMNQMNEAIFLGITSEELEIFQNVSVKLSDNIAKLL